MTDYRSGGKVHSKRSGKTKAGGGFGKPMSIPEAGGSVSRDHATGIDKKVSAPKKKKKKTMSGPHKRKPRSSTTALKYAKRK